MDAVIPRDNSSSKVSKKALDRIEEKKEVLRKKERNMKQLRDCVDFSVCPICGSTCKEKINTSTRSGVYCKKCNIGVFVYSQQTSPAFDSAKAEIVDGKKYCDYAKWHRDWFNSLESSAYE